jgi:hypothetical protein
MRTQTKTCTYAVGEDRILRVRLNPGARETLENAKENIVAVADLLAGRRLPILVDYRLIASQERAARAYYASPETGKHVCAVALLVDSPLSRIIGNFFMGLNKPPFPVKVFGDEAEALAWLTGFLP